MAQKMTKGRKRYVRYSICFKEKVIQEISEESSISEVSRRYGIKGGDTVQGWIKKFGRSELLNEIVHVKTKGEVEKSFYLCSELEQLLNEAKDIVEREIEKRMLIKKKTKRQ
jgi:transposase-like protein